MSTLPSLLTLGYFCFLGDDSDLHYLEVVSVLMVAARRLGIGNKFQTIFQEQKICITQDTERTG